LKFLSRIKTIFEKAIGPAAAAAITAESDIENVPGWDSQSFLPLIIAMEDEFEITVSTMDAAALFSVEAINAYLEQRLG
jgi:acyl carrier protein